MMHPLTDQELQVVLDFASKIQKTLQASGCFEQISLDDCAKHIARFPCTLANATLIHRKSLDKQGTQLWNACRNGASDEAAPSSRKRCHIRALAYFMVEAAQTLKTNKIAHCCRILRIALRTAKDCLAHDVLNLAGKVLERAAAYHEQISAAMGGDNVERPSEVSALCLTYLTSRITLAWKQGRLVLADHFFCQVNFDIVIIKREVLTAEALIDLLLEIGNDLLEKKQDNEAALLWLERGHTLLEILDPNTLTTEAGELRLCLLHTYVRALLAAKTTDAVAKAFKVFEVLQQAYPSKLSVQLLKFEIIAGCKQPDGAEYFAGVMDIAGSIHLTDSNVNMLLHHIHQLRRFSPSLAAKALSRIVQQRLASSSMDGWIERSIVILIWLTSTTEQDEIACRDMPSTLTSTQGSWKKSLSAEATQGALILIWKAMDHALDLGRHNIALQWCHVALHPIFSRADEENIQKIERRLLLCHIHLADYDAGRLLYDRMPEHRKGIPLTCYLAFKLGIKSQDEKLATESFEALCYSKTDVTQYLLACLSETLQTRQKQRACQMLRRLEKSHYEIPSEVNSLTILRCTLHLLISEPETEEVGTTQYSEAMCRMFESAILRFNQTAPRPTDYNDPPSMLHEAEWFSKICYNTLAKHCTTWPTEVIERLYAAFRSLRLAYEHIPCKDTQDRGATALVLSSLSFNCDFIMVILSIKGAREENDVLRKVINYEKVTTYAKAIHDMFAIPDCGYDLSKYHAILCLDFERAIWLHDWDHLNFLIDKAISREATRDVYATHVNCILAAVDQPSFPAAVTLSDGIQVDPVRRASISTTTVATLLCRIVSIVRSMPGYDIVQASRWLRCIIQTILEREKQTEPAPSSDPTSSPSTYPLIDSLTTQAIITAQESIVTYREDIQLPSPSHLLSPHVSSQFQSLLYPSSELEWLSTTLFNRSIDHYIQGNDPLAREWAKRAIEIADVLGDMPNPNDDDGDLANGHSEADGDGDIAMTTTTQKTKKEGQLSGLLRGRCEQLGWSF